MFVSAFVLPAHTHPAALAMQRRPAAGPAAFARTLRALGFITQKIRALKGSPSRGKEAFRPAQGDFYAIVPFQHCIKAAKEGGFLMVPREQSGNIRPNFITESSETLEERFPLIIINSRKKSFTPKAGSICPSVFSHLHFKRHGSAPAQRGDSISAPLSHGHSKEIQTGSRLT